MTSTQLPRFLKTLAIILFPLLFHYLFFHQKVGINLLITELLILAAYPLFLPGMLALTNLALMITWIISAIEVLYINNTLSITTNILCFLLLTNTPINDSFNLPAHFLQIIQRKWIKNASATSIHTSKSRYTLTFFLIPALVTTLFFILYASSIPSFLSVFENLLEFFPQIRVENLLLLALGLALALYFWLTQGKDPFDHLTLENLIRVRRKGRIRGLSADLRSFHTQAQLTLLALLILGGLALALDMCYFWFSEWKETDYNETQWALRKGTGMLILAILASIAVAIKVFQGNLALMPGNGRLKNLTYAWLVLNILLTVSLCIRTLLYIEEYNLAYKRIGVLVFCVLAIYALGTVIYKTAKAKNSNFLIRTNLAALFICFLVISGVNWDRIVVKYNFNHPNAYMDLDYLFSRDLNVLLQADIPASYLDQTITGSKNYEWMLRKYGKVSYRYLLKIRAKELEFEGKKDWRSWDYRTHRTRKSIQSADRN